MTNQTFNDGVVSIYSLGDISQNGNMPKEGLTLIAGSLRYHERTVGMGRFWTAAQATVKIDLLLRCPQIRSVSTQDIAIPIDGKQYKIVQIQYPENIDPPVMDLSLERIDTDYDIA